VTLVVFGKNSALLVVGQINHIVVIGVSLEFRPALELSFAYFAVLLVLLEFDIIFAFSAE